jgi:hypothetical protein
MNDFFYYLQEGFQHIVNLQSYDYLLFILVLEIAAKRGKSVGEILGVEND